MPPKRNTRKGDEHKQQREEILLEVQQLMQDQMQALTQQMASMQAALIQANEEKKHAEEQVQQLQASPSSSSSARPEKVKDENIRLVESMRKTGFILRGRDDYERWIKKIKSVSANRGWPEELFTAEWDGHKSEGSQAWTRRKEAFEVLRGTLDQSHESLVDEVPYGDVQAVWSTLAGLYRHASTRNRIEALNTFTGMSMAASGKTITFYLADLDKQRKICEALGATISDEDMIGQMLRSVLSDFSNQVDFVENEQHTTYLAAKRSLIEKIHRKSLQDRKTGVIAANPRSERSTKTTKKFNEKAEDCRNFRRTQTCKFGAKCRYRHQNEPIESDCRSWAKKKKCDNENCQYRHSSKPENKGVSVNAVVAVAHSSNKDNNIYLDCASTYSIANNPKLLAPGTRKECNDEATTLGGKVSFKEKGTMVFSSISNNEKLTQSIPRARLGDPDGLSLISLGELDKLGFCFEGGKGKLEVFHPRNRRKKLIVAHRDSRNLYPVDLPVKATSNSLKSGKKNSKNCANSKQSKLKCGRIHNLGIPNSGGTGTFVNSNGNNNSADTLKTNHGDVSNSENSILLRAFEEIEDQGNQNAKQQRDCKNGSRNDPAGLPPATCQPLNISTPPYTPSQTSHERKVQSEAKNSLQTSTSCHQNDDSKFTEKGELGLSTGKIAASNRKSEKQLVSSEELLREHERRSHLNFGYLLSHRNWQLKRGDHIPRCHSCMITKPKRRSPPKSSTSRSTKPGEKWHMDIVPSTHVGTKGERYMLLAVDDCSRLKWMEVMTTKDCTLRAVENLRAWTATKLNQPIRELQMDSESLFKTDEAFKKWMTNNNVEPRWSAPYVHEQNGVVERHRGILGDAVRATHSHANNTSWRYWCYSHRNCLRLLNELPTSANDGLSPLQKAGLSTSSKHPLEEPVLFCKAYAFIYEDERKKKVSSDRARECMYLGKEDGNKSYLVEDLKTGKVYRRYDVNFVEDEFPRSRSEQEESWNEREQYWKSIQVDERTAAPKSFPSEPATDPESTIDDVTTDALNEPYIYEESKHAADNEGEYLTSTKENDTPPNDENKHSLETSTEDLFKPRRSTRSWAPSSKQLDNLISESEGGAQLLATLSQLKSQESNKNLPKIIAELEDPKNKEEAMSGPLQDEFIEAENKEMASMYERGVLELIKRKDVPRGIKIMGSRMLYKIKRHPDQSFDKAKCRLIYQGLQRILNVPPEKTFAPAVRTESLRILLALAIQHSLKIDKLDIGTFYLYGKLEEPIYMTLPKGLEEENPDEYVYKVQGNIYGNPEAGQVANKDLVLKLEEYGFKKIDSDEAIFIKESNNGFLIIGDYVDDIVLLSNNNEMRADFLEYFGEKYKITHEENPTSFRGLEIERNGDKLKIHQRGFIDKTLDRFGMTDCKPTSTPAIPKPPMDKRKPSKPLSVAQRQVYQQKVGDLIWLLQTRPDIHQAVSTVCRKMQSPTEEDEIDVKRIQRYLKGSRDVGITFSKTDSGHELRAAADASFADRDDGKSTQGYHIMLANGPVIFKSTAQRLAAQSTTEAECISCSDLAKEILWTRNLLSELGFAQQQPTELLQDNQAALKLTKNAVLHARTKHFRARQALIRDLVIRSHIQPEYTSTEEMPADIYTKPLHAFKFKHWREINQGG